MFESRSATSKMLIVLMGLLAVSAQLIEKSLTATENKPFTISCEYPNSDGTSIIWKKGSERELIAVDEDVFTTPGIYEVEILKTNNILESRLTILRVEPIHSDDYYCELVNPDQVKIFHVKVNVAPIINIHPTEKFLSVKVGEENLVIACKIKEGNPIPNIMWNKPDGLETDVTSDMNNTRLIFPKMRKEHSGTYTCEARNIAGSAHQEIHLNVEEEGEAANYKKPWIRAHKAYVPVKKHNQVEISCEYDGLPVPLLEWYFNGYKLNYADEKFKGVKHFAQRLEGFSKSTLKFQKIEEDTFGDYACRASNKLGNAQVVVHVSGKPGPPTLTYFDNSMLRWSLTSLDRVLEYELCYRIWETDQYNDCNSVKSGNDNVGNNTWEHTIDLHDYLTGGNYELQIRARNIHGWGSYPKEQLRVTLSNQLENLSKGGSSQNSAGLGSFSLLTAIATLFVALGRM